VEKHGENEQIIREGTPIWDHCLGHHYRGAISNQAKLQRQIRKRPKNGKRIAKKPSSATVYCLFTSPTHLTVG